MLVGLEIIGISLFVVFDSVLRNNKCSVILSKNMMMLKNNYFCCYMRVSVGLFYYMHRKMRLSTLELRKSCTQFSFLKCCIQIKINDAFEIEFCLQANHFICNSCYLCCLCYSGYPLLRDPHYNKGLAFTERERDAHFLRGLLPPVTISQDLQVNIKTHYSSNFPRNFSLMFILTPSRVDVYLHIYLIL